MCGELEGQMDLGESEGHKFGERIYHFNIISIYRLLHGTSTNLKLL